MNFLKRLFNRIMKTIRNFIYGKAPEKNKVLYAALELDSISQNNLKTWFKGHIKDFKYEIEKMGKYNIVCHHMTIFFYTDMDDEIYNYCVDNNHKKFDIIVKEIGISDKAAAVKVETKCKSKNKIKHITLATSIDNGGKAVDSNYITNWTEVCNFELSGKVTFYEKN